MKKTVISLLFLIIMVSFSFGQGFTQIGVMPPYGNLFGGLSKFTLDGSDAGRGMLAGTDLDGDGKYETWVTSYPDHRIYCFEQTGTDTLEFVWMSAENTADASNPRDIVTGDLDNDGKPEIMFFIGEGLKAEEPTEGLQIYEWDGTDNGYGAAPSFIVNFFANPALNDSLIMLRVENFTVGDIDKDGTQEILIANNGNSAGVYNTRDGSPKYSEDRFIILSIEGDIGAAFGTSVVEEFAVSPRDFDKDGNNESGEAAPLGGGSPTDILICDTDGDGLMEAACFSYNNLAVFFLEATGPDAYTLGATTHAKLAPIDDFAIGASAADMDGDGKDEVYVGGVLSNSLYVIKDMDGDATNLDVQTETAVVGSSLGFGCTAVPGFGVIMGGNAAGENNIFRYELTGSVLKPSGNSSVAGDWTETIYSINDALTGSVYKIAEAFDFDGDGNWEFGLPYQTVKDLLDTDEDGNPDAIDTVNNRVFRVVEWDENYVGVKDITFIMPDDYRLEQNYPNPFNPTTSISYSLPIQNNISVNIYNFLGEHVVTLVNNKSQQAGVHEIVWNSLDKNGSRVASGTYFYELKYGNFSQTKRMTLLK